MPWEVEKRDGPKPWKVVKKDSGKVVGSHGTRESAKAHQTALYANTKEGSNRRKPKRTPVGGAIRRVRK